MENQFFAISSKTIDFKPYVASKANINMANAVILG
jgi:hypothetical protein